MEPVLCLWCRIVRDLPYFFVAKLFGADVVTVPARKYGHDLPAMRAPSRTCTRIVFVANPTIPRARWRPREELIKFVNYVPDNALLVTGMAYLSSMNRWTWRCSSGSARGRT